MGINVFKPRCAIPIGKPCTPLEGGGRRLAGGHPSSRSLAALPSASRSRALEESDPDDITLPFDIQVYSKEQIIFRVEQTQLVVVVPVVFFFEAAIVTSVNLRGAVSVSARDERLTVGLVSTACTRLA
jgi:hypothetical protein